MVEGFFLHLLVHLLCSVCLELFAPFLRLMTGIFQSGNLAPQSLFVLGGEDANESIRPGAHVILTYLLLAI